MATLNRWSDIELRTVLIAYLDVLAWEGVREPFSPTTLHRFLIAKAPLRGRSEGSIARRMSNISAVLLGAGEPIVQRYKPSFNHVGAGVTNRILSLLHEIRASASDLTTDRDELEARSTALLASGRLPKPIGSTKPGKRLGSAYQFERSAEVVAWVRQEAGGFCDACGNPAPFVAASGRPFLEVHHVRPLAAGGPDVVENAIAVCPNCHRRLHHSADSAEFKQHLFGRCPRLVAF